MRRTIINTSLYLTHLKGEGLLITLPENQKGYYHGMKSDSNSRLNQISFSVSGARRCWCFLGSQRSQTKLGWRKQFLCKAGCWRDSTMLGGRFHCCLEVHPDPERIFLAWLYCHDTRVVLEGKDQIKMKYLTISMTNSRSPRKSSYATWLRFSYEGDSSWSK